MNKVKEVLETAILYSKKIIARIIKHKKVILTLIILVLASYSFYTKQSAAWIAMHVEPSEIVVNHFNGKITSTHTQGISLNNKGTVINTTPIQVHFKENIIDLEPGELEFKFESKSYMGFEHAVLVNAYLGNSGIKFEKRIVTSDAYFYSTRMIGNKQEVSMSFIEPLLVTLSGSSVIIIKGITQETNDVQSIEIFPDALIGIMSGKFLDCDIPIGDLNGKGNFQMQGSGFFFATRSAGKGSISILQDKQTTIDIFPSMIIQGSSNTPLEITFNQESKQYCSLKINGQLNNLNIANTTKVTDNPLKLAIMHLHSIIGIQHLPMK